jgi:hypothetical protein
MTTLIVGERGEGKTTLAMWLARQRSAVTLIFEPKMDETIDRFEREHGAQVVFNSGELYEALQDAKSKSESMIFFVPGEDVTEGFEDFIETIKSKNPRLAYCFGGVTIVIDEAWALMTANSSHRELERLLRIAPRNGEGIIHVIVLAHRPSDINNRTHMFTDELFIFRTTEEPDLEKLDDRWNPNISPIVSAFPDGGHMVLHYNKNNRQLEQWQPDKWKA